MTSLGPTSTLALPPIDPMMSLSEIAVKMREDETEELGDELLRTRELLLYLQGVAHQGNDEKISAILDAFLPTFGGMSRRVPNDAPIKR